jgi:hypothetical protein
MVDTINMIIHNTDPMFEKNRKYIIERARDEHNLGSKQRPNEAKTYTVMKKNFMIRVSPTYILIGGSLPKFLLGDNLQTLTKGMIKEAIMELQREIGIGLLDVVITRFDIAQNLLMEMPVMAYINRVLRRKGYLVKEQPNGKYIENTVKCYFFYDKIAQMKKESIKPWSYELLKNSNVLRYESRYTTKSFASLGVPDQLTVRDFIQGNIIDIAVQDWVRSFLLMAKQSISIYPSVKDMAGLRDGVLARGGDSWGGIAGMLEELRNSISAGHFKQSWLRQDAYEFIDKVTSIAGQVKEDPLIKELRLQVLDAASHYAFQC